MADTNKLKPEYPNGPLIGLLAGIFLIFVFILLGAKYGERTVDVVVGSLLGFGSIVCFFIWFRTKSVGYLVFMLWQGLMGVRNLLSLSDPTLVLIYRIIIIPILLVWLYMIFTKKITWHYRKILELAARPVNETADGFTPRPYPAGEAQYSKEEIIGFGNFMAKNLAAFPYVEKDRVLLIISRKEPLDFLSLRREYDKETYVSFDYNGNVVVNIAKKEYDKYKEEFTFDQLCESLSNLFKQFLHEYQNGDLKSITETLKR